MPQNRAALVANAVEAAKAASVPYLLVVSVSTAGDATVFGSQFEAIETNVKASGIPFTFLRLPLFTDNLWYAPVATACVWERNADPECFAGGWVWLPLVLGN